MLNFSETIFWRRLPLLLQRNTHENIAENFCHKAGQQKNLSRCSFFGGGGQPNHAPSPQKIFLMNLRERQKTHHPQFCTGDVDRRFCGGGAWISRSDFLLFSGDPILRATFCLQLNNSRCGTGRRQEHLAPKTHCPHPCRCKETLRDEKRAQTCRDELLGLSPLAPPQGNSKPGI